MSELSRWKSHFILTYDVEQYDFASWAREALGVEHLHRLHERPNLPESTDYVKAMEICRSELLVAFRLCRSLFRQFFELEVAPLFHTKNTQYQIPPVFRVHLHGGGTVSASHRDRDHGVASDRLNMWLPLTRVWGNNSLWIESPDGVQDPVCLDLGQAVIFDGPNLLHGSVFNDTGSTRVSLDCRFLPGHDSQQNRPVKEHAAHTGLLNAQAWQFGSKR